VTDPFFTIRYEIFQPHSMKEQHLNTIKYNSNNHLNMIHTNTSPHYEATTW